MVKLPMAYAFAVPTTSQPPQKPQPVAIAASAHQSGTRFQAMFAAFALFWLLNPEAEPLNPENVAP
jgi:hypothetical protein